MNVYIATREWGDEGSEIIGIYASKSEADKACAYAEVVDHKHHLLADSYEVEEHELIYSQSLSAH